MSFSETVSNVIFNEIVMKEVRTFYIRRDKNKGDSIET